MAELIIDIHGNSRGNGTLLLPPGYVSALRSFEEEKPVLTDAEIRAAITDPDRPKRRKMFGQKWMMDQKSKNSCNGFAGAGGMSKARWLRGIMDGLLLSGAYLYSLINNGKDAGSYLNDSMIAVMQEGIAPASMVPWDMIYSYQMPPGAKAEAAKHKGLIAYPVQTRQGLRTAAAVGYPVIVAVQAGGNFQYLNKHGICGVDHGYGNHAVHVDDLCLVGGTEVFDLCNSWGLSYGDYGRAYATWDSFEQCMGSHCFWALSSTEEYGL